MVFSILVHAKRLYAHSGGEVNFYGDPCDSKNRNEELVHIKGGRFGPAAILLTGHVVNLVYGETISGPKILLPGFKFLLIDFAPGIALLEYVEGPTPLSSSLRTTPGILDQIFYQVNPPRNDQDPKEYHKYHTQPSCSPSHHVPHGAAIIAGPLLGKYSARNCRYQQSGSGWNECCKNAFSVHFNCLS